jgi:phosphohistidine phosphatase
MKTLLLMRHAKSSWDDASLADFDRPLNGRGKRDAPLMGKMLARMDLVPDLIIASTARRAARTAELVAQALAFEGKVTFTDELYHASPDIYVELARLTPQTTETLLMVGHNPGIEEAIDLLCGIGEHMPTGAIACLRLPVDNWNLIAEDENELQDLWRPKEL